MAVLHSTIAIYSSLLDILSAWPSTFAIQSSALCYDGCTSISSLMLPLAAISTSATSLQHPLAAILLLCHWYNLLWRIFYFYAILTTYSGGHPTFCNDASTYIYFSLRLLLSSSLHHPLAAILLLYHHFNLLWRPFYYYIIL